MKLGRAHWVAAAISLVAVTGCGDGDDEKGAKTNATTSPTAITAKIAGLPKPLLLRCGTEAWEKPRIAQTNALGGEGRAWRISYTPPTSASRPLPRNATNLLLIEEGPAAPRGGLDGGRNVTIGGRRVNLVVPRRGARVHIGVVKTSRARYTLLANMPRRKFNQIVGCLP